METKTKTKKKNQEQENQDPKKIKTKTIGGKPKPEFVNEKFNVIPIKAVLPETPPEPVKPVIPPFTEADIFFLSETATSTLPCLIWSKLTPVPKDLLDKFNHELYLYCVRKGYDPRDYLFDEMGIAVAGLAIGSFHYTNYKEAYSKPALKKVEDKLNADYNHIKKVAEEKETKEKEREREKTEEIKP